MALFPRTGVIYRDDNLDRLRQFEADSVDLIYLDPPFFSNRHYEVIWGDESELRSFEDRWKGGIGHYIGWMKPRLQEMRRVLKPTGSIYLHCDPHASHYLKVVTAHIRTERRETLESMGGRSSSGFRSKSSSRTVSEETLWTTSKRQFEEPRRIRVTSSASASPRAPMKKRRELAGRVLRLHSLSSRRSLRQAGTLLPAPPRLRWSKISSMPSVLPRPSLVVRPLAPSQQPRNSMQAFAGVRRRPCRLNG